MVNGHLFALYRYFDADDRLLYVGMSGDLAARDSSHIAKSRWMELAARSTSHGRRIAAIVPVAAAHRGLRADQSAREEDGL
jgi:hypothetical protein